MVFVVRMRSCQGASEVGAGVECGLARLRSRGRSGFVCWTRWGRFFWFVRWRGDDWRDLLTDFERRHAAGVLIIALTLDVTCGGAGGRANERGDVGAAGVAGVGVGVDGVVVTAVAGVEGAGGVGDDDAGVGNAAAVVVAAVGDVGVVGAGIAGDAGGVDVAGICDVGVEGVERAGGGGGAGGVVGVEGARGIDDAAAAVSAVAVRTRGWPGVHKVGSAGSSDVEVEGVLLVFERKAVRLVGAFQVTMKKGGKVVGRTW